MDAAITIPNVATSSFYVHITLAASGASATPTADVFRLERVALKGVYQ